MTSKTPPPSPLDQSLTTFLTAIEAIDKGYLPGPDANTLAAELDVPRAFIDMLFVSARTRGLLKPSYGRGSKIVWHVSPAGLDLIGHLQRRNSGVS